MADFWLTFVGPLSDPSGWLTHRPLGSVGDCYDNAMYYSFFATLKYELLERSKFNT